MPPRPPLLPEIQEKELTKEEMEEIEIKANKLIKEASRKHFCHKAMKIVITLRGKPFSRDTTRSVQENELLITLEKYDKTGLFYECTEHDISIHHKGNLVYRCREVSFLGLGYTPHEIITYSPGEWERRLFDLYNKLPEYEKKMEEERKQGQTRELKSRFRL